MVPFFVADRPMSLRLLKDLPLRNYPRAHVGVMAHANTTLNFQQAFRHYPCDNLDYCDAVDSPCQHRHDHALCPARQCILNRTVKMCDSGIFTREGATLTYDQLFETYERMGVEYGIMIDVFRDPQATLASARGALQAYKSFQKSFRLIGVAHGDSIEEYLSCYTKLKQMGFDYVAVGGLLRRRKNTVRFPYVEDEGLMFQVLRTLRQQYPDDWLFALGCLHPSRLSTFKDLNVWADYKGWIFQYEKRDETLDAYLEVFVSNHLQHLYGQGIADQISTLQQMVMRRNSAAAIRRDLFQRLVDGRRMLRASLSSLYQEVLRETPDLAGPFKDLTTHGLLDGKEERIVVEVLARLGKQGTEEAKGIRQNVSTNRRLKTQVEDAQGQLNQINHLLAGTIGGLRTDGAPLSEDTQQLCAMITSLVRRTEREHRFEQVQDKIADGILAQL